MFQVSFMPLYLNNKSLIENTIFYVMKAASSNGICNIDIYVKTNQSTLPDDQIKRMLKYGILIKNNSELGYTYQLNDISYVTLALVGHINIDDVDTFKMFLIDNASNSGLYIGIPEDRNSVRQECAKIYSTIYKKFGSDEVGIFMIKMLCNNKRLLPILGKNNRKKSNKNIEKKNDDVKLIDKSDDLAIQLSTIRSKLSTLRSRLTEIITERDKLLSTINELSQIRNNLQEEIKNINVNKYHYFDNWKKSESRELEYKQALNIAILERDGYKIKSDIITQRLEREVAKTELLNANLLIFKSNRTTDMIKIICVFVIIILLLIKK